MAVASRNKKSIVQDNVAKAGAANDGKLKSAAIFAVDSNGVILKSELGVFLLNPGTWTESKAGGWVTQNSPGQSDAPLQWAGNGARTVNFQALVTADTSDFVGGQKPKPGNSSTNSLTDQISSVLAVAGIANNFFKVADPTPRVQLSDSTELDISNYLDYYRSLLYPLYDDVLKPTKLRQSPPLIVLYTGNTLSRTSPGNKISSQDDIWVLTNLEIQVTKQLPNLAPMEANVTFQLTQYNIRSFDRRRFLRG